MSHPAPFSADPAERASALAFLSVRGVGPVTLAKLTEAFGSLAQAGLASPHDLAPHLRSEARAALSSGPSLTLRLEQTQGRLAHHGATTLFRGDPGWPAALADLGSGEPLALFIRGTLRIEPRRVAVVGSRQADRYGCERARRLGARLAEAGLITVSGGAQGVDTEAHRGALEGKGATFAVLGSGFDFPFPRPNAALFDRIVAEGGALITELTPSHEPKSGTFPRRNTVVAALGEATVVVRGDTDSGALLTATDAHRLGRPLLAVPGRVDEAQSRGAHLLLRLGWAKPCCDFSDVLATLGLAAALDETALARGRSNGDDAPEIAPPPRRPQVPPPTTGLAADVWSALGTEARHFDQIVLSTGASVAALSVALTQMEVAGQIEQLPGKHFARR